MDSKGECILGSSDASNFSETNIARFLSVKFGYDSMISCRDSKNIALENDNNWC